MIRNPTPDGCRHCGIAQLDHYTQAASDQNGGLHTWTPPTDRQRLQRMRDRRARRQEAGTSLWQLEPVLHCAPGDVDRFTEIIERTKGVPGRNVHIEVNDDLEPGEAFLRIGPFRAHHTVLHPEYNP